MGHTDLFTKLMSYDIFSYEDFMYIPTATTITVYCWHLSYYLRIPPEAFVPTAFAQRLNV